MHCIGQCSLDNAITCKNLPHVEHNNKRIASRNVVLTVQSLAKIWAMLNTLPCSQRLVQCSGNRILSQISTFLKKLGTEGQYAVDKMEHTLSRYLLI